MKIKEHFKKRVVVPREKQTRIHQLECEFETIEIDGVEYEVMAEYIDDYDGNCSFIIRMTCCDRYAEKRYDGNMQIDAAYEELSKRLKRDICLRNKKVEEKEMDITKIDKKTIKELIAREKANRKKCDEPSGGLGSNCSENYKQERDFLIEYLKCILDLCTMRDICLGEKKV